VASILPFIRKGGTIFDDKGQPAIVYEVIAKRIIDAARKGERDPVQLRNIGLAAFGFKDDKRAS
jgi:hypothetical protein